MLGVRWAMLGCVGIAPYPSCLGSNRPSRGLPAPAPELCVWPRLCATGAVLPGQLPGRKLWEEPRLQQGFVSVSWSEAKKRCGSHQMHRSVSLTPTVSSRHEAWVGISQEAKAGCRLLSEKRLGGLGPHRVLPHQEALSARRPPGRTGLWWWALVSAPGAFSAECSGI